jgi:hypothetical protein
VPDLALAGPLHEGGNPLRPGAQPPAFVGVLPQPRDQRAGPPAVPDARPAGLLAEAEPRGQGRHGLPALGAETGETDQVAAVLVVGREPVGDDQTQHCQEVVAVVTAVAGDLHLDQFRPDLPRRRGEQAGVPADVGGPDEGVAIRQRPASLVPLADVHLVVGRHAEVEPAVGRVDHRAVVLVDVALKGGLKFKGVRQRVDGAQAGRPVVVGEGHPATLRQHFSVCGVAVPLAVLVEARDVRRENHVADPAARRLHVLDPLRPLRTGDQREVHGVERRANLAQVADGVGLVVPGDQAPRLALAVHHRVAVGVLVGVAVVDQHLVGVQHVTSSGCW